MIITPSVLENAKRLLARPADGSKANIQARARARRIVNTHADNLQAWVDKNPSSPIALQTSLAIDNLRLLAKKYLAEHTRQTEVEDHFSVYNNETGETIYEKFPRSMELTCDDVLSYYE